MTQSFKTFYLPGHPASDAKNRHVRLAFGPKESDLYEKVRLLTSEEMRQQLGVNNYEELKVYSEERALSLNRACISILHQALHGRADGVADSEKPEWNDIDPLLATYRGATGDVFHDWYPLLEGFSSRFVSAILDAYAPHANLVLDPFGGTGSTPVTVAGQGLTGYYCEVNPALQLVIETKTRALQIDHRTKARLVEELRERAFAFPFQIGLVRPDAKLRESYHQTFNSSRFFDEETFLDVLRLRTLCDELEAQWPLLGKVFTVASMAGLVPASFLKRAGDLRFKTEKEMASGIVSIRSEVSRRLNLMASDLESADLMVGKAVHLLEDARHLALLPGTRIDAVITSPPYLNGTNYFRNTKLELWFIRAIVSGQDLAFFRNKAVTAGINDVTKAKCEHISPPEAQAIVSALSEVAYDTRIPLMVGGYFHDMEEVLRGLSEHVVPGGKLAIDIGDSRYSGLHIETDSILAAIAQRLGFRQVAVHNLRIRKSRDAGTLRQSLLVFEAPHPIGRDQAHGQSHYDNPQWTEFKVRLPHQLQPFAKRNWGHPWHSLCSYQGKMKPALAHFLIKTFVPSGGSVVDPFCGVGTIPFEACLQGKRSYGFDISPAAIAITAAKLGRPDPARVREIVKEIEIYISSHQPLPQDTESARKLDFNRSLVEFYHPSTLDEILLARRFFGGRKITEPHEAMVLACLLHILHGNRPYALSRRSHSITPFAPTGEYQYKSLCTKLKEKVERSLAASLPPEFVCGAAYDQDATSWWPRGIENIDAIITSPPFFDSTRFYLANWIRLWFCGWEKDDFNVKPLRFVDSRQKESMGVYEAVFRQAKERLSRTGVMVLHLGKSSKCDMARELGALARPWFRVIDQFEESVANAESHGVTDKGEVTGHQYLVMH